jgi:Fic family protein
MNNVSRAIELKAQLDALRPLSAEQEQRIWQKFRFDWNYHSNNIEGNSLTFGETKSLLLHNITAQGKSLKDHIEITGHNEAISALLDVARGSDPLTESFIRNLHTLILRERYQVDAQTPDGKPTKKWIEVGQYKTAPNHVLTVTGEIFRFAEPIEVPSKMQQLVSSVNAMSGKTDLEALVAAAKAHYELVVIHPFDDGNGRMARLVMNLVLIKHGFPPAIINTQDKENYFAALRQADGGQFEVFVDYVAKCVCASLHIMLAGARGESIEETDEQDRQIKMLARLLDQRGGRTQFERTASNVQSLFESDFRPLVGALYEKARLFQDLYLNLHVTVQAHGTAESSSDHMPYFEPLFSALTAECESFAADFEFSHLRYRGGDGAHYSWTIFFQLHPSSYMIVYNSPSIVSNNSYQKQYGEHLQPDEMKAIIKHLTSAHIAEVERITGVKIADVM